MCNKSFTKECLLRTIITILVMVVLSLVYSIVGVDMENKELLKVLDGLLGVIVLSVIGLMFMIIDGKL